MVPAGYICMILFFFLAEALPVNGLTTEDVAKRYPNLMLPAPFTLLIWAVIFLWLGAYIVWRWKRRHTSEGKKTWYGSISRLFVISCAVQMIWMLLWHLQKVLFSLLAATVLLGIVGEIVERLRNKDLTASEYFYMEMPFSFYLGWIFFSVLCSMTSCLVSAGWNGMGMSGAVLTAAMVAFAGIYGVISAVRYHNTMFAAAVNWGLAGILWRHWSTDGWNQGYPGILAALLSAILAVGLSSLISAVAPIIKRRKKARQEKLQAVRRQSENRLY